MSGDLVRESLETLYEDAPCGYIFMLPDGTLTRVNQTFLAWTGYTTSELNATRFQELLTVPGRIFYENQYMPLLHMQGSVTQVSFDLRCQDGRRLPVLVNSTLRSTSTGQPALIASTIFDASDRERYEHELRSARARAEQLAAIVTSASDAIVRATADGQIETWNTGAERLFGYPARDMLGQSLWELLPSLQHDADRRSVELELQAGRAVYLDGEVGHADGQRIDVSVGLMPHPGLLGELVAISAIMRDISQRRVLERMQQEFLAMTSHELRHPLTNIRGQAQLMRRRASYSERSVDSIIEQANQLGRLVDDLLLASLIDADRFDVQREPMDLVLEVQHVVEQLQGEEYNVQVDARVDELLVSGDRQRLGQVFSNLLSNAVKYSPAGSDITVRIRSDDERAFVDVVDRGIGIPPEDIPQLFSRFFRAEGSERHARGLGLGLYIAHRIVRAHGGTLTVQSAVGEGSTFTITLPRCTI